MPVNVKLLKKVRKLIAEEPRRLDMESWGYRYNAQERKGDKKIPPCGTIACLAGHIILANTKRTLWARVFGKHRFLNEAIEAKGTDVPSMAAKLIGIPKDNCPFWHIHWGKHEVLAWIDRQIDAASK